MIRNAVVKKTTPKDVGFSASNTKVLRTTAGDSIINNSNVTNVQRLNRSANDNEEGSLISRNPQRSVARTSNDHKLKSANKTQVKEVANKAINVVNAGSAAWFIVGVTWILYMVQFVFALLSLMGIGAMIAAGESWVGYLDVMDLLSGGAQTIAFTGMAMTAVMGIFTLIVSIAIFMFRGVDIGRGMSVPIMALCFALNALPAANLAPWIWVWCIYVVKSQTNNK